MPKQGEMANNIKLQQHIKRKLADFLYDGKALLLVGFSGGRDSLALLHLLHGLSATGEVSYRLVAAHLNHNLRGAEADADEAFCREFCRTRGIEYVSATADLSADMPNLEMRAREARYRWFADLRKEYEAQGFTVYLLTAHHLEDQAETVLLHLLRGSGTGGMAAMSEVAGWHLRPLLDVPRQKLEMVLQEGNLDWREDSSNQSVDYTRNFLRLKVLPLLRELNPGVDMCLAQTAALAAAEEEYFDGIIKHMLEPSAEIYNEGNSSVNSSVNSDVALQIRYEEGAKADADLFVGVLACNWEKFADLPLAIRRRLVRAMWCRLTEKAVCGLNFTQVGQVLALKPGGAVNLSGAVLARRRGGRLEMLLPSESMLAKRRTKSRKGQQISRKG